MMEQITYNFNGGNITVGIDRETGEIDIVDYRFKLNIQNNKANLVKIENNKEILICAGYLFKDNWYFSGQELSQKDPDPYLAAVKFCNGIPHQKATQ